MKRFIFLSLLVTTPLLSDIESFDLKLENVTPVQLRKIEELSEISEKITKKQTTLKQLDDHFFYLFDCYSAVCNDLEKKLDRFMRKFEQAFQRKKDVKGLLADGFSVGDDYEFCCIKVFFVRRYFERLIMAELVKQYENCLLGLLELLN